MKTDKAERISSDDPRLTAYALGELDGADREAVEAALRDDAALRAAVEEIRATVAQLEKALAGEALPVAPEMKVTMAAQSKSLAHAAITPNRSGRGGTYQFDGGPLRTPLIRFPQFYYVVSGLAAACFVVLVLVNDPGEAPMTAKVPEQRVRTVINVSPPDAANGETMSTETVAVTSAPMAPESPTIVGVAPKQMKFQLDRLPVSEGISAGVLNENFQRLNPAKALESQKLVVADKSRANTAVAATGTSLYQARGGSERNNRAWTIPAIFRETQSPATESYAYRQDAGFLSAREHPLSTFAADVDTASYSNVRRMLRAGQKPPVDAVRVEELVNYFPYQYQAPKTGMFAAELEVADAPWAAGHRLVRIGLKAREVTAAERGAANLVFLVDVSGSMNAPERLPLVKESLRLLVHRLRADDRVAIVTYAGASGLALASTPVAQTREVVAAIDAMTPGGSTNGGMGIQLAYDIAKANFVTGGVNRVILCTDGDFNVGVTGEGALVRLVQEKAKSGVFLTVLGYGMGNLKDGMLEAIADKGDGSYGYVDSRREAEKLLGAQVSGTLTTVAKDVKLQVEFNPARVASYRLIGYENRLLAKTDFNNDKVDAGEVGAGHTVTALYEIVPTKPATGEGREASGPGVDELKYSRPPARVALAEGSDELLTLKVRFKEPAGEESRRLEFVLTDSGSKWIEASADFKFAGAVAAFGMVLRDSPHKGTATWSEVQGWAEAGAAADPGGWRGEFLELVRAAAVL